MIIWLNIHIIFFYLSINVIMNKYIYLENRFFIYNSTTLLILTIKSILYFDYFIVCVILS
jgi:hypothetical protein